MEPLDENGDWVMLNKEMIAVLEDYGKLEEKFADDFYISVFYTTFKYLGDILDERSRIDLAQK